MASINPASPAVEYSFTVEEAIAASTLSELQILLLHTKRAQLLYQKASTMVPETPDLDRSYWLKLVEIDGKIGFIDALLLEHSEALKKRDELKSQAATGTGNVAADNLAQRASNLVNKS